MRGASNPIVSAIGSAATGLTARTIVLRSGVHYIGASGPLELTALDSSLRVQNYPNETAWISGGIKLERLR